jgi:mannose-6-phosphate isomerase-like protein (cupin superfamily)
MTPLTKSNTRIEKMTVEKCFITELLNTEDFHSFSIAKARVEPGAVTESHRLNNTDEVYYILSGKGEIEINGKIIGVAEPGDLVFIQRNTSQRIRNLTTEDLIFLCICSPRFEFKNYQ